METANLIALLSLLGIIVAAYVIIKMDGISYKKDIGYLKEALLKLETKHDLKDKELQNLKLDLARNGIKIENEK
jgi:hypothetical protein